VGLGAVILARTETGQKKAGASLVSPLPNLPAALERSTAAAMNIFKKKVDPKGTVQFLDSSSCFWFRWGFLPGFYSRLDFLNSSPLGPADSVWSAVSASKIRLFPWPEGEIFGGFLPSWAGVSFFFCPDGSIGRVLGSPGGCAFCGWERNWEYSGCREWGNALNSRVCKFVNC
jgi:hypothetical protein